MGFNSHQWYLQGLKKVPGANTFIGGVASTILTKASLATKLGLSESNISYFKIVEDEIQAKIEINYVMPANAWNGNNSITYFIERNEGKCLELGTSCFSGSPNLYEVIFLKATYIDQSVFTGSGLRRGIFHEVHTIYYYQTFANTSTVLLYLPKLKFRFGTGTLPQLPSFGQAKAVYMPIVEQIGNAHNNDTHFLQVVTKIKIWANPILQTINAGAEEGDIAWARANKSAIISYSSLPDNGLQLLTPPNTFSESNTYVYAYAIKLIDDESNLNSIDSFKVWVNGVFYGFVKKGSSILNLNPATTYNISAIVIDEFFNESEISSEISITTSSQAVVETFNLISSFGLESITGDVIDSHSDINGVVNGSVTRGATGFSGNCFDFSGGEVRVANNAAYNLKNGTTNLSYATCFWVNLDSVNDLMFINKRPSPSGNIDYQFSWVAGNLRASYGNTDASLFQIRADAYSLQTGRHFFAIRFDLLNNQFHIIRNSTVLNTVTSGSIISANNGNGDFVIGKAAFADSFKVDGKMDEVRTWIGEEIPDVGYFLNEWNNNNPITL